jgi:5-methylcytosine-specific restriction endonuclease McrA
MAFSSTARFGRDSQRWRRSRKPLSYDGLRQPILRRDGWRRQRCGTMTNLELYHRESESLSSIDSEENLIRLCSACHAAVHSG